MTTAWDRKGSLDSQRSASAVLFELTQCCGFGNSSCKVGNWLKAKKLKKESLKDFKSCSST